MILIRKIHRWYILALLTAVLVLACSSTPAFAGKMLVAAVMSSDIPRYNIAHRSLVKALAQKGYDQSMVEIISHAPNPDPISWANVIRKFQALGADLIVTYGAPATLAAIREATGIPILFVDVYAPVETGVTRSMTFARKNLSGISSKVPMITLVKTAMDIRKIKKLGVIYNSREAGSLVQFQELKRIAVQEGFAVVDANLSTSGGLDQVLNALLPQIDCLFVSECFIASRQLERIITRANSFRVPVISLIPDSVEKGAMVSLEISPAEQGQMAGEYAARVLNGAIPGEMPILVPNKIDLVVNMRAAKV